MITRGDEHVFLGMRFKIKHKKIEIRMKEQLEECVKAFGEDLSKKVSTPASKSLFEVKCEEDDEPLCEKKKVLFHSIVAKLLFLMKRVRPDLEPSVAFLCTRVTKSTIDDWNKLRRVLRYVNQTLDDPRIIGAKIFVDMFVWIDASFAVHANMRGQTGGCMSTGLGVFHAKSSKQKINTKSTTESELVGVSEYMPYNIWAILFLEAQGYKVIRNVLFQDNQSAILMQKNGRNSCTGNSRHINVRYFWIKDRVDNGDVLVKHCPTEMMLADFFTKALQGKLYHLYRDVIMGYEPISVLLEAMSIKERVEDKKMSEKNVSEISSCKTEKDSTKDVKIQKRRKSYKEALLSGDEVKVDIN